MDQRALILRNETYERLEVGFRANKLQLSFDKRKSRTDIWRFNEPLTLTSRLQRDGLACLIVIKRKCNLLLNAEYRIDTQE